MWPPRTTLASVGLGAAKCSPRPAASSGHQDRAVEALNYSTVQGGPHTHSTPSTAQVSCDLGPVPPSQSFLETYTHGGICTDSPTLIKTLSNSRWLQLQAHYPLWIGFLLKVNFKILPNHYLRCHSCTMKVSVLRRDWPAVTGTGQMPQAPSQDPAWAYQLTGHTFWSWSALRGPLAEGPIQNDRSSPSKSSLLVPAWRDILYYQGLLWDQKHQGQRNTPLGLQKSPNWL